MDLLDSIDLVTRAYDTCHEESSLVRVIPPIDIITILIDIDSKQSYDCSRQYTAIKNCVVHKNDSFKKVFLFLFC